MTDGIFENGRMRQEEQVFNSSVGVREVVGRRRRSLFNSSVGVREVVGRRIESLLKKYN